MKRIKVYICIAGLLISSCATGVKKWANGIKDYAQVSDKVITVQAAKLPYEPHDSLAINFRVRLIVNDPANDRQAYNEKQMYQMDSCFYVQSGAKKYYPALIQAVTAGVSRRYEYLVSFDGNTLINLKRLNLVYKDRYINKKSYTMLLK